MQATISLQKKSQIVMFSLASAIILFMAAVFTLLSVDSSSLSEMPLLSVGGNGKISAPWIDLFRPIPRL